MYLKLCHQNLMLKNIRNRVGDVSNIVKTCTTVDLGGDTTVYRENSLHLAALKNVQLLQCLIDNYNGDIINIINRTSNCNASTPLDCAYDCKNNNSSIRKDRKDIFELRKYGGKANNYDKNGNEVEGGKGDLNDILNDANDALSLTRAYQLQYSERLYIRIGVQEGSFGGRAYVGRGP